MVGLRRLGRRSLPRDWDFLLTYCTFLLSISFKLSITSYLSSFLIILKFSLLSYTASSFLKLVERTPDMIRRSFFPISCVADSNFWRCFLMKSFGSARASPAASNSFSILFSLSYSESVEEEKITSCLWNFRNNSWSFVKRTWRIN